MSADRYEISECELDVLAITGPEGTRYIDGEDIEAKIIRQQARDIAELRAELQMCCELKREYQERAAVAAEQADQLRADLAAAVAARANMDTDRLEWMTRAEQAEARLAAIGAAPTVASLGIDHDGKHRGLYFPHPHRSALTAVMDARDGWTIQELIARPAKD